MKRYQTYGLDAAGRCTHAGTHDGRKLSLGVARKIQRDWLKWRNQYLVDHPGNYPLREDANTPERKTVSLVMHEVGRPDTGSRFPV